MELKFEKKKADEENLIPLINIVFLILIFFLITTVIRPFSAKDIKLAEAMMDDKLHKITHSLVINETGDLSVNGERVSIQALGTALSANEQQVTEQSVNIIADKALPADKLLDIVTELGNLKFNNIKLVIEKSKK